MAEPTPKLDPAAVAFYRGLPSADYPVALIEGYPRIANHIAALRGNKVALRKYFESLITVNDGGRQGFSLGVLSNIQILFDIMVGIPDGFAVTDELFPERTKKK